MVSQRIQYKFTERVSTETKKKEFGTKTNFGKTCLNEIKIFIRIRYEIFKIYQGFKIYLKNMTSAVPAEELQYDSSDVQSCDLSIASSMNFLDV